ncbi:MAG: hypothetical protein NT080_04610 [Spirochaetes bacterium]|nr:hypothetical protein [Spirochaetota bacterium]
MNSPREFTDEKVTAEPKSTMTQAFGAPSRAISSRAATAAQMRSLPTSEGISVRIFTPVRTPGPTVPGTRPKAERTASPSLGARAGTTQEIHTASIPAPRTPPGLPEAFNAPASDAMSLKSIAYSSAVRSKKAPSFRTVRHVLPSRMPTVTVRLRASIARSTASAFLRYA